MILAVLLVVWTAGCSVPSGYQEVKPTVLDQAPADIPETQLLDIGVSITTPLPLKDKELKKLGTNDDVRRSEAYYIPCHLKNTLQKSAYWGAVGVVPDGVGSVDLRVRTELVKSNGELLQLTMEAVDASGRTWLSKKYHQQVTEEQYTSTALGEREIYQNLYNTAANDLAAFRRNLSPAEIEQIRLVSRLQFAGDVAPDAYGDYLETNGAGRNVIMRLPADDDPFLQRIEMVRQRDGMFVDTLNQYYEGFYVNIWDAYENYRQYNLAELVALRKLEEEAFIRTVGGILMIAAGIALAQQPDFSAATGVLVVAGGQVMMGGINLSEQKQIHAEAIQELADSFGTDLQSTVVELEGKQYELTGTVEQQYDQWRGLLRQIYLEETGFDPDTTRFGDATTAPARAPGDP